MSNYHVDDEARLDTAELAEQIEHAWARRGYITTGDGDVRNLVDHVLARLEDGTVRVAELLDDMIVVHEWVRQAILLAFRVYPIQSGSHGLTPYADRVLPRSPVDGVRFVPGAVARRGTYLGVGAVLMPSFVNIGARVGRDTLVDTWATVGSCAQVGDRVHIAGGAGIGGVLEPPGAVPVFIEDDTFIGSRAMVVEGARVREGAKLGAGTLLTGSTRVFDAQTGAESEPGTAPAWSVCVGATRPRELPGGLFNLPCLLVLTRLEPGATPDKLSIDTLFREHGAAS